MKKYFIISFLFFSVFLSRAQMVYMPDSAFRAKLISINPAFNSCITGDSIDVSCGVVIARTSLNLSLAGITDLRGIEAFVNLTYLDCSNNQLTSLPNIPASLTYFSCEGNQLTSLTVLPSSLTDLVCGTNQLSYLPALPSALTTLDCRYNQLFTLPSLPGSLTELLCDNNQLTNLPSLPPSLNLLFCYINNLTALPVLPNSLRRLVCFMNPLYTLPLLPDSLTELNCIHNQLTNLPSLPHTLTTLKCSNNLLTSLPSLPDTLVNLECDWNQLTTLPSLPNPLLSLSCIYNQLNSLPALPASLNHLSCNGNNLTSLPVLPASLISLYCKVNHQLTCLPRLPQNLGWLDFSSCPLLTCVPNYVQIPNCTPALSSLPLCDLNNSNGCDFYWNISGKSYLDDDTNCTQSVGEPGLNNIHFNLFENSVLVHQTICTNGGLYSFDTDHFGNYEVRIDTASLPFDIFCPLNNVCTDTISAIDSIFFDNDFAVKCKNGFDVGVTSIHAERFRPARYTTLHICAGDMAGLFGVTCASGISGTLTVTIQGSVQYSSPAIGAISPSNVSANILTWNIADFGTIHPCSDFNVIVQTDTTAALGSSVCVEVAISSINPDNDQTNNVRLNCFTVQGSYDPNDKQVYPEGIIDTAQHWLTYTINFQNTGSASADDIYIIDTLDNNLDPATFQLLTTSHPAYIQIFEIGIAKFNFPNINLPDSSSNEPQSHGYVQYKLRIRDGLPMGTQIQNTGYIYFDFNPPVVTNTVGNSIDVANGVAPLPISANLKVWPVPFQDKIMVTTPDNFSNMITVVDITGKVIFQDKMNTSSITIDTRSWTSGTYFLKAESAVGVSVKLLVKQ